MTYDLEVADHRCMHIRFGVVARAVHELIVGVRDEVYHALFEEVLPILAAVTHDALVGELRGTAAAASTAAFFLLPFLLFVSPDRLLVCSLAFEMSELPPSNVLAEAKEAVLLIHVLLRSDQSFKVLV